MIVPGHVMTADEVGRLIDEVYPDPLLVALGRTIAREASDRLAKVDQELTDKET